ncbi:unnamed protein product [Danaus chrysippus]|uniref:(African queen) hypothetical protein n=1 Tax=Danaus chrysippus TaxID=151541 RepID=A0A8J2QXG8_9NEOP|nr:unnamed protein product [Danaus chrysippus]
MDISKLCRCCMKEVASWEKENFSAGVVEMFCFCTNIKATDDEKLPKQFCYDCVIKIESCYTFIKEAQNVNITLKNMASRSETRIIINPDKLQNSEHQEHNKLKLTLPDYKLSIGVSNYEQTIPEVDKNISAQVENNQIDSVSEDIQNDLVQLKTEDKIPNDSKKNVCPVCRKEFMSKKWFSKHMEKEHSGHKYTCSHCPKTFSKPFQLAYHSTTHSEERNFPCLTCGKSFKRRKQLTIHIRSHSDVRPFACDKCSRRFKDKSVLKSHMKVHDNVKQYLCSYCGWSFAQASNLKVHLRTHTGAKPHACTQCGFRSSAASSLRRHQRRHQGARLYVCEQCRKGFFDASGLARHSRTHSGELPYQCPGCTRSFPDSWKRKTHLMRAHRLPLQDIPRMRSDGRPI